MKNTRSRAYDAGEGPPTMTARPAGDNDVMGRLTVCILPGPAVQEKLVYHGPGVGTSVQIVVCPFVLVQRLHWTVEINADNGRPGHCTIIS
jgi:hypothetical protein